MNKLTQQLLVALVFVLAQLGGTMAWAQDEDTMLVIDDDTSVDDVAQVLSLPDQAATQAGAAQGLDKANSAMANGREFGREQAAEARAKGQEERTAAAADAREKARQKADEARQKGRDNSDELPEHPSNDISLPEPPADGAPETPGKPDTPPANDHAGLAH